MAYNKILIHENEEFPYSEELDVDGYFYRISIIWNDRNGELVILNDGSHIVFDDDGSYLDFNIAPKDIFPDNAKLSENDLIEFMGILTENQFQAITYSQAQIYTAYQRYLKDKQKQKQ